MAEALTEWDRNFFQMDEDRLQELGYRQELLRNLSPLHSFGVSFSIICSIVYVIILFPYSLAAGGPAGTTISWLIVSLFSCFIALSIAEIVSALPTSGGPYFWAAKLSPPKYSAFASWITGWFNFIGLVSSTASLAYGLSRLITAAVMIKREVEITPGERICICTAILLSWVGMNTIGRPTIRHQLYLSIALNSLGVIAFAAAILIKAPKHQSAEFVFKRFIDKTGPDPGTGWAARASPAYIACISTYMASGAFFVYDSSSHIAEETLRASWIAPLGIISSVAVSMITGFLVIVAILVSFQDIQEALGSTEPTLVLLQDLFGDNGAIALYCLPIFCCWYCGLFTMLSTSRMIWSFSRDNGIPRFFSEVNEKYMCPVRAVGLSGFLAFLFCLTSLGSSVVYTASVSIAVIGILISYGIPVLFEAIYHDDFITKRGPFNLSLASRPIAIISVLWIIFSCVALCLPTSTPITLDNLNYGPIAIFITLVWAVALWVLRARKTFVGPVRNQPIDLGNLVTQHSAKD